MHSTVFLHEAIDELHVQPGHVYVDATFGVGGHTREIVRRGGHVLAIDLDHNQVANQKIENVSCVHGNFADIQEIVAHQNLQTVSGILFDLGLAMNQLWDSDRGFSYRDLEDKLDMRINSLKDSYSASEVLNTYGKEELEEMFSRFSEHLKSYSVAEKVIQHRQRKPFETVNDFLKVLKEAHVEDIALPRYFQALRIEVNTELHNLQKALEGSLNILQPGGKIVVISFHSLEHRIVKLFGRDSDKVHYKRVEINRNKEAYERSAQLSVLTKQ